MELPALPAWSFNQDLARRIAQPVLAVVGADSGSLFDEGHHRLQAWLPRVEACVVPGVTHALPMTNAREVATALAGFFARHGLRAAA